MAERMRQLLALAIMVHLTVDYGLQVLGCGTLLALDPATSAFLVLSVLGLALRFFWARFLTICFCASLLLINGFRSLLADVCWLRLAELAGPILLLSGRRMQAFFEGRAATRLNGWACAHRRVLRLRWLILAQSLVLGVMYAGRIASPLLTLATLVLAGSGILGLVLLRTWGLAALAVASVLEVWVLLRLASFLSVPCLLLHQGRLLGLAIFGSFTLLVGLSLVVMLPFIREMGRRLVRR